MARETFGRIRCSPGEEVLGFYASFESAFKAGVKAFGVQRDFLVKQVLAREPFILSIKSSRRESLYTARPPALSDRFRNST
jgi:hypothetical protein